jgi:adenylate kinase
MLVWCTGISGSGRKAYIAEAAEYCEKTGRTCRVIDVGDLLEKVPDHIKVGPTATALLDGNEDVLRLHRLVALNALKAEIEAASEDLIVVSTHACFMRRARIMTGLDMHFIKKELSGKIDVFATVIHDCHDSWIELQGRPEWQGHLSLQEFAVWRDFEMVLTKMLAEYEGRPFYLLARRDPAAGLAQLAQAKPTPSLYLSYPITAIQKEDPALLDNAKALAGRLRSEGFVVFDPLSIRDVPGTRAGSGTVEGAIPPEMEAAAAQYLNSQAVVRDLQLIDQADMVVVYYPTDKVSPGVYTEMSHARDRRKPLYLIAFPGAPESVSPFLGLFYSEAFKDIDQAVSRLKQVYFGA